MEFTSSPGVVESGAGEGEDVAEDLVVPQRNRPWKYIPQFSDEDCRLLRVEDQTQEGGGLEDEDGRGSSGGDGLLQYYRHNRTLESSAVDGGVGCGPAVEEDDLNGDLEVMQLAQVVYGRAPPSGEEEIREDPVVPVRIDRRSEMDAPWPEEGEEDRPSGDGLTFGGGTWEGLEEPLIENVEQLQWRAFSSAPAHPFRDEFQPPPVEGHLPPSQFADFPPLQYSPESHETEKEEALWDEINNQVAESMATAATLSSGSESEAVGCDATIEVEPMHGDVTLEHDVFAPLECTVDQRQLFLDNSCPVPSAEAEKEEGAPQERREEEEEAVEEMIVEAKVVSQSCGVPVFRQESGQDPNELGQEGASEMGQGHFELGQNYPELSKENFAFGQGSSELGHGHTELGQGQFEIGQGPSNFGQCHFESGQGPTDLGQGPCKPEVELRIEGELAGERSIIETSRTKSHHPPEVPQVLVRPGSGSSHADPPSPSEETTRGRSKEPRHQGGTLPPAGSRKVAPEKGQGGQRSRRSRSESFFGFLRRKSRSRDPESEEEKDGKGGKAAEQPTGGREVAGSAKTTPSSSRSTPGSEVKVKKSRSQGQSFFEKLGFGRTSKKSEKDIKTEREQDKGGAEEKRKKEEEAEKKEEAEKQVSKTNIRIFEILAKNEDQGRGGGDTEAGQQHPTSPEHHHQHQHQGQEMVGRDVLTDRFDPSAPERRWVAEDGHHLDDYLLVGGSLKTPSSVAETGASVGAVDVRKKFIVAVAIDFGTAFSGYAFCFLRDPDSIHMMGRWEDGDPGLINQKTPTTLLLTPQGQFHSFGFTARNNYHDLSADEAKRWLYFDRFKMALYENQDCSQGLTIEAANGERFSGVDAISMTLRFFGDHALDQISSQSETKLLNDDVLWVVTVPAIWNASAKQLMRIAAYKAGLASSETPDQLLVALEPEAASVHIRRLQLRHLVPDQPIVRPLTIRSDQRVDPSTLEYIAAQFNHVVRYMVVDCGGGTVDITVHELNSMTHRLQELHVATGGPHGSFAIDGDFARLLGDIFGADFIDSYRRERPSGWVGFMMAFESRKRAADPRRTNPLNVALPFSFIEHYRKTKGLTVDAAIRGYGDRGVRWSSQGMLRLTQDVMKQLFRPTLDAIKNAIHRVLNAVKGIDYIFLVGGLSESAVCQCDLREEFKERVRKVVIPQEANLAVIKGAVVFGLDPAIISVRRSKLTYGAAVLNRFIRGGVHPDSKLVVKDGVEWCRDVFDVFVSAGQVVRAGETVVRQYIPATPNQTRIVIGIFCTEHSSPGFVSDPGVRKCANVSLDLTAGGGSASVDSVPLQQQQARRRIEARLVFAETEIKVTATDTTTGKQVDAAIDFLNV